MRMTHGDWDEWTRASAIRRALVGAGFSAQGREKGGGLVVLSRDEPRHVVHRGKQAADGGDLTELPAWAGDPRLVVVPVRRRQAGLLFRGRVDPSVIHAKRSEDSVRHKIDERCRGDTLEDVPEQREAEIRVGPLLPGG
jgi:hypothetical protein